MLARQRPKLSRNPRAAAWLGLLLLLVVAGCSGESTVIVEPVESGAAVESGTGIADGPAVNSDTFALVVEFAPPREAQKTSLAWMEGMTVMDALRLAAASDDGFRFEHRGSGATAFVWKIDDVENQGGKERSRNWIFKVNGSKSPQSAGIAPVGAADVVLWKFSTAVE